jgi:hypothetical protein
MPIFVEEQRLDACQNKNAVRGRPLESLNAPYGTRTVGPLTPRASISEKCKTKKKNQPTKVAQPEAFRRVDASGAGADCVYISLCGAPNG